MTAPEAERTIRTVCPHDCPDACSLLATVQGGMVKAVKGDPDHPFTRGWLCGKVARYEQRVHSPERLLSPLRRTGPKGSGVFEPISWDVALETIASRWKTIIAESGPEAVLGYAYSGHQGLVSRNLPRALFHAIGASRMLAGTVCDSACGAGWEAAVGPAPGTDLETIVESDFVLVWGANLLTTNPHLWPLIEEARDKGARVVVVDPFRTRTARKADVHIRPLLGTDTALALGVMHILERDGLVDRAFLRQHAEGYERLAWEVLPEYTPGRVAAISGIPADDIERLAGAFGSARAPFVKLGMGLSRHRFGGATVRTIAMLPAVVGAWGKPGGGAHMDSAPVWQFDGDALRRPDLLERPTREVNHSRLGRALLEFRDPPIRALFVMSNNPATTCPDQVRVEAGLLRDDLFTVVHDTFMTDTARFADIVLPAATSFESDDLYRSYGTQYLQYGPAVIDPVGEARPNLWVVQELARRMALTDPVFARSAREHIVAALSGARGGLAGMTLGRVEREGPIKIQSPGAVVPFTRFFAEELAGDALPGWRQEQDGGPDMPLRLLTLPGHALHHTAFSGVELLRRRAGEPTAVLHPVDAAARGVSDGDGVLLRNALGEVGLRARVSDDTLPGVVAVEGARARSGYLRGGPINVLVSDDLTDLGAGATYQSTYLEVERL